MNFILLLNTKNMELLLRRSEPFRFIFLISHHHLLFWFQLFAFISFPVYHPRFVFTVLPLFSGLLPSLVCHRIKSWQCLASWRGCCWRWQRGRPLRDPQSSWLKRCYYHMSVCYFVTKFFIFFSHYQPRWADNTVPEKGSKGVMRPVGGFFFHPHCLWSKFDFFFLLKW